MKTPNPTWGQDVWPWLKNKLVTVQFVIGLAATIIGLITVLIGLYLHIKTSAQSAVLDDPKFLERLAEQVRPVCLLNSKGYFYDDYGALAFIAPNIKIEFANDGKNGGASDGAPEFAETISITIHAKQFLRQSPIMSSIDGSLYLLKVEREGTDSWRYTFGAVVTHVDASMGYLQLIKTNAEHLFRLEVLH